MTTDDVPTLDLDDLLDPTDTSIGVLAGARGLFPLIALDVDVTITGTAATTNVVQRFVNHLDEPIEATYIFPLPDRAAVVSFTARLGERTVEGVLRERADARRDYDAALAAGHPAAIAEEDRPDCFTVRVGNLRAGELAELELVLVGTVGFDLGEATYRFPLVIAPRYIPGAPLDGFGVGDGTALDTSLVPDASRITPPVLLPGAPNPVAFRSSVRIDPVGRTIRDLRSTLRSTSSAPDADGAITLEIHPGERLDRDLVVRWTANPERADSATAVLVADERGDEGTINVVLTATEDGASVHRGRDVVVVLDRSGSMSGWKMIAARRAASRVVDSLTADDRFAVIAFDHSIERPTRLVASGLVAATDHHRFAAVEFLSRLEPRGGTEMAAPLVVALDELHDAPDDRRPVVVLVTDGQVGDEDHILGQIGGRIGRTTTFTIGIDRAVNAGFLRRLAGIGGGRCELVESEDRLDAAFRTIRDRLGRPTLRDLAIEVDGAELIADSISPRWSRDVYHGAPLTLSARVRNIGVDPSVTVIGTSDDGTAARVEPTVHRRDDRAITSVWARSRVRDLEDAFASGHVDTTPAEIVATSLRFNVLSRFTAFVAVDDSVAVDSVDPILVVQPVEPPGGWMMPAAAPQTVAPAVSSLSQARGQSPTWESASRGAPPPAGPRRIGRRRRQRVDPSAPVPTGRGGPGRASRPVPLPHRHLVEAQRLAQRVLDLLDGGFPDADAAKAVRVALTQLADDLDTVASDDRLARLIRTLVHAIDALVERGDDATVAADAVRRAVQAVLDVDGATSQRKDTPFWSEPPSP